MIQKKRIFKNKTKIKRQKMESFSFFVLTTLPGVEGGVHSMSPRATQGKYQVGHKAEEGRTVGTHLVFIPRRKGIDRTSRFRIG